MGALYAKNFVDDGLVCFRCSINWGFHMNQSGLLLDNAAPLRALVLCIEENIIATHPKHRE